jgi:hypothetical protein
MPDLSAAADSALSIMPLALLLLPPAGLTTICSRSEAARDLRGLGSRVAEATSACAILKEGGPIFFAPAIKKRREKIGKTGTAR